MEIGVNDIVTIKYDTENKYQIIQMNVKNLSAYSIWGELNGSIGYLIKNIKTQEISFIPKNFIQSHLICDRVKKEQNVKK